MRTRGIPVVVALVVLLGGLALARGPRLEAPVAGRGHIGVSIASKNEHADEVYFVRLKEGTTLMDTDTFLRSNFRKEDSVYLLNARPGRYVAVGAAYKGILVSAFRVAYFSQDTIPLTEVSVTEGHFVFMGRLDLHPSDGMSQADPVQRHFFRLIRPEAAQRGRIARATSSDTDFEATITGTDRGAAAERAFWGAAGEKHFAAEPDWLSLIEGRLAELGS